MTFLLLSPLPFLAVCCWMDIAEEEEDGAMISEQREKENTDLIACQDKKMEFSATLFGREATGRRVARTQ